MNTQLTPSEFSVKAREIMNGLTDKTQVILPIEKNCELFWSSLARDMYYHTKLEQMSLDGIIKENLREFRESGDDLDVVNKQGRILKRFAKFYVKNTGNKLSDEVAGIIGDRLQYYLNNQRSENVFTVDFATSFNWKDGMYGKDGSCYWGCYAASRPTLEHGGAFCIRFYSDMEDTEGIGRTWILVQNGALVCFNSYGVERSQTSKVLKQIFKGYDIPLHFYKVELFNSHNDSIPYLNGGSGFFLIPEGRTASDILNGESKYDIDLTPVGTDDENSCTCDSCGRRVDEDDVTIINDEVYCERCRDDNFSHCEKCGEWTDVFSVHTVNGLRHYSELCESCLESVDAGYCELCHEYSVDYIVTEEGELYCDDCKDDCAFYCDEHNEWHSGESCPNEHESEEEEDSQVESDSSEIERDFTSGALETVTLKGYDETRYTTTQMIYRDSRFPGLFVIQNADGWSITHENSGASIKSQIDSHVKAFSLLDEVAPLTNWEVDFNTLQSNRTLLQNLRLAVAKYL